ncbi:glycosyltransferase family 4 protein [Roseovarius sp. 2305UL8-3]|uniref:glycosyltransferase family 4 protein n=1 Tax=Roseovarius conchicola TaxID=3121636 RepID=UPI003529B747
MTRIAFYAPLKSPRHPTPSGDRQMARNLIKALGQGLNADVDLMSELRSREPDGQAEAQARLMSEAQDEITRLIPRTSDCALWVTYHNYYKAPDLIGPHIAAAHGIPYVLIEATRAKSRLTGPWAGFAKAAEAASNAASAIFSLTARDRVALDRDRTQGQQIVPLAPFVDRDTLPDPAPGDGPMLTVGMMRPDDKLESYRLLAQALESVTGDWHLQIAGDGPARPQVEALFAPFAPRVTFLGALDPEALAHQYAQAGLFVWPGVNEAFGMVYIEAQIAGLPIVAQDRPGVRDVLPPGDYPTPEDGPTGLAARLNDLLSNPDTRHAASAAARQNATRHLMPAAAATLRGTLTPLIGGTP